MSKLLAIPTELRLEIFQYALSNACKEMIFDLDRNWSRSRYERFPGVLYASRQLHTETEPIFFKVAKFSFHLRIYSFISGPWSWINSRIQHLSLDINAREVESAQYGNLMLHCGPELADWIREMESLKVFRILIIDHTCGTPSTYPELNKAFLELFKDVKTPAKVEIKFDWDYYEDPYADQGRRFKRIAFRNFYVRRWELAISASSQD
ncbi:MAG: hypothetical protein M1820_000755 [Bogoriella megaspora]|nr:MAG: hypothetical protein M1820_000755 [Bogoriella megaspora]